jgi:pyruvate dehydrogenase E2 component (dihydrolipoamide acetyltransferase)
VSDPVEFRMPDVGEGIAEAAIVTWQVAEGDTVAADQPLVVVETDKSQVELPSPADGTVLARHGAEGALVSVGDLLVVIGDLAGPAAPPAAAVNGAARCRVPASPYTRRLAVQHGVDLTDVRATGPHGRVLASDVERHVAGRIEQPAAAPSPERADRTDRVVPVQGLRRQIARTMTEALTIPHITEFREVDATNLLAARAALKPRFDAEGLPFSVLPLLLAAVVRALGDQPRLNATYDGDREELTERGGVHLGIATATDDGLIVPVVRDADRLGLDGLTREVNRLADRARDRTATPQELTGGSFTVTNFGSFGTWLGNPVIRPPEVGIAGFGRITDKVIAVDGVPTVRPVLPIVVATDHRINDGADLARFATGIADVVAQPLLLLA